jgi:hypothetical protein
MPSSGMLRHVALVRKDILEQYITSIIRVPLVSELGTMLSLTSNQSMLQKKIVSFAAWFGC